MNKKFLISYTIFATLVFVFSIAFFSLNIYKEYKNGKETAGNRYYNIGLRINNASQKDLKTLNSKIEGAIKDYNELAAIQIKADNKVIYSYPNVNFTPVNTKLINNFSTDFESPVGKISISANIYILKPFTIAYYSKLSFLIVLIITLITIILIIYLNISENKRNNLQDSDIQEIDTADTNEDLDNSDDSIYMEEEEIYEDFEVAPEQTSFELIENETAVNDYEVYTENEETSQDTENESSDLISNADEEATEEEVKLPYEEFKPVEITEQPTGLFNPETGLGWESYLNTRLSSELTRAISSEFDLSLFLIKLPELDRKSELFSEICDYLILQFQFKDLLFEYKEDCLVALKISMNLDEALTFSDNLYVDLKNILGENKCYMGISSRSIRMVSSERLLLEAEEALKHAQEETDSPVVAFKVDAEKYREYMEKNSD